MCCRFCPAFPQSLCSIPLSQVNRGSGEPWAAQQGGPVPGRVRHELSTRTNAQEHCRSESRRAAWAVAAAAVGGLLPPVSRQLQKRQSDRARRHCGLQGCAAVAAGRARTASGSRRLLGCAAFRAARTRACHCLRSASAAGAQHQNISLENGTRIQKWIWVTIKLVACKYRQYKSRIQNMIVFTSPSLSLGIEVRNRMQFFHSLTTLYHIIFVIVPWDSGKPKQI